MRKSIKSLFIVIVSLMIIIGTLNVSTIKAEAAGKLPSISYQAHVQGTGWLSSVNNGATAGTTGQSRRLECIKINLKSGGKSMIKYRAHIQGSGWQGWKTSGQEAGTTGKSLRLEAVQIKLTGNYASKYDIYYRVHVAGAGWLDWTKNGATAGSTGSSLRAEAIQIKLVSKGTRVAQTSGCGRADITKTTLTYKAKGQYYGWQKVVGEGATAGTTGQSRRMEAISINLKDYNGSSGIRYSTHVSHIGWQGWKTTGQTAGVTNGSEQIEAIKVQLTGEIAKYYNVYYRMHVAGYGWLGWASNGAVAGTTGGGIRAEAIQIKLVAKAVAFDKGGTEYIDGANITKSIHLAHHMSGSLDQNSYRLYGDNGENWGCCATAYAIGLSIVNGRSYNPESFWRYKSTYYDQGRVNNYTSYNAATIYNNLLAGKPTMVHYEYIKSNGKHGEHWVLVIGIRSGANKNNIQFSDFTIIDPWGGAEKNLTSAGYFGSRTSVGMKTFY